MEIKSKQQTKFYNCKVSDLISITCHFNSETLLTKNADLVKTIEIQGFIDKDSTEQNRILRDDVRSSIIKHIKDPDIAIHIHVIRDYKNIMPDLYQGPEKIVSLVENEWCKQNSWNNQLVNTLYITLIKKRAKIKAIQYYRFFIINIFLHFKAKI